MKFVAELPAGVPSPSNIDICYDAELQYKHCLPHLLFLLCFVEDVLKAQVAV